MRARAGQPDAAVTLAWRAQTRLHRKTTRPRWRRGKRPTVAVTAVARELAGFVWAVWHLADDGRPRRPEGAALAVPSDDLRW